MLKDQTTTQASRSSLAKKLSPELNEFLHMLDSLEIQSSTRETAASQTR
jgi:hypothetical protein